MKYINNSINKKFSQGFNNILSPSLINLFIALSLLIILALIYLKYNKLELYQNPTTTKATPTRTYANIYQANLNTDTGYMSSIVNNYIKSKKVKNNLQDILNIREQKIQNIASEINKLLY
jgi:hypothetical protein